jgi:hypothetical protein
MKKWIVCGLAGFLTACQGVGGVNMPRIISGDADGFIVYQDGVGANWNGGGGGISKKKAGDVASYYCSQMGKTAELVSRGGALSECVSNQLDYCMTYRCD